MLTGAVPFDGDTDFSVKEQQINLAPPDPRAMNPAISPALAQCVQQAMAKEPAKRFQNCGEFLASIDAYQAQASGTKVTPAKWGLAAALAGLMIAVGAGIYFSKPVRFVVDEEAMLQKEHETGFILIQGAAEKASLACRELREIDLKRQNLEIAKGFGDTGLVDAYTTQIEEIAQNIRDHASEYKNLIGSLVGIKKPVAEAEFERYANELLHKIIRPSPREPTGTASLSGPSRWRNRGVRRANPRNLYRSLRVLILRVGGERRDVSQDTPTSKTHSPAPRQPVKKPASPARMRNILARQCAASAPPMPDMEFRRMVGFPIR